LTNLQVLADETGNPVLYQTGGGASPNWSACCTFPDRRWLRFLVRGTSRDNAIMTAVDQAGIRVIRYRLVGNGRESLTEVAVHPGRTLTDELVIAIAASAPFLSGYFSSAH